MKIILIVMTLKIMIVVMITISFHQLITLETLWPSLAPGGIYIVEDVETSYWGPHASLYGYSYSGQVVNMIVMMMMIVILLWPGVICGEDEAGGGHCQQGVQTGQADPAPPLQHGM